MRRPAVALSVAGSDPSGGAGIQADLKTFHALGVYGTAAMTALTSQNTTGVRGVHPVPADFAVSQVEAVLDDLPVDAVKTGMLGEAEVVEALAGLFRRRRTQLGTLVVDPVMVATSGDPLLAEEAEAALRELLVPLADVITPNLPEAARLLGGDSGEAPAADDLAGMREQALALLELGPRMALLKGGHLDDDAAPEGRAVDVLAVRGESAAPARTVELSAPRVPTRNTHGTGCTLSSAIAAHAARAAPDANGSPGRGPTSADGRAAAGEAAGQTALGDAQLVEAVREGKRFLSRALHDGAAWRLSRTPLEGHGPVDHLSQVLL